LSLAVKYGKLNYAKRRTVSEMKREGYWSKFADGYEEGVDYIVGKSIQQKIIESLSEEHNLGDVVEFGCGTGYFTKAIAKNAKHVIATDLSNEMLEVARKKLKEFQNITIQKADCENIAFQPGKFDTVLMANVIHYIKNPKSVLRECGRILKAKGLLLLVDYTGYSMKWSEKIKLIIRFYKKCGMPPRYFKSNLSPDEFTSLAEGAGFEIERIQLVGEKTKALYLKGRKQ
jgi:ubiquinone/menaquinone biosynthesis C-methylase UbiE